LLVFVNLSDRNVDLAVVSICFSEFHLLKNVLDTSWSEAFEFMVSLSFKGAIHSEGFAASSLSVGKDADIFAINCRLDELVELVEEGCLSGVLIEHFFEVVVPLRLVVVGFEVFFVLSDFDVVDADLVVDGFGFGRARSQTAINSDVAFVLLQSVVGSSEAFREHLFLFSLFEQRVLKLLQAVLFVKKACAGYLDFGFDQIKSPFKLLLVIVVEISVIDMGYFHFPVSYNLVHCGFKFLFKVIVFLCVILLNALFWMAGALF
jgi:hypothetical protein